MYLLGKWYLVTLKRMRMVVLELALCQSQCILIQHPAWCSDVKPAPDLPALLCVLQAWVFSKLLNACTRTICFTSFAPPEVWLGWSGTNRMGLGTFWAPDDALTRLKPPGCPGLGLQLTCRRLGLGLLCAMLWNKGSSWQLQLLCLS